MENKRHFDNSSELCEFIAAKNDTVILSFSMGKDSIASYLQLKQYFKKIVFVYFYLVPDLDFINKSLAYYEDVFQDHIIKIPNPNLYDMLRTGTFQTLEMREKAAKLRIPKFTRENALTYVKEDYLNNDKTIFSAVGVRASDNLRRRTTVIVHGVVNYAKMQFFPIFDWNQKKLIDEIEQSKIKLPEDYKIWGCSFDGLHYKFLKGVYENYPNDYAKIKEWFPLIDAELLRYNYKAKYV